MVDPEDAHVRAAPRAALLDHLRGHVEDPHERHRAAGSAAGGLHRIIPGPEPAERKTGPAAALVDERGVFDAVEYRLKRVLNRKDKTGGKLLEGPAGIHQGRGIREELESREDAEELLFGLLDGGMIAVQEIGLCNIAGHPSEKLFRRFHDPALLRPS